jgi:hypothetical protein
MPWIRYDCAKLSDKWYLKVLTPEERNAFDLFLLHVKAQGSRGSVPVTDFDMLSDSWRIPEEAVRSMFAKASQLN